MPATQVAQIRAPLPEGASPAMHLGVCRVCGSQDITVGVDSPEPAWTRSAEPVAMGPDGAEYEAQHHHDWCPVWTGEQPDLACPNPHCGAPITSYDYRPGYQVKVPGLNLHGQPITDTWVGAGDELPDGKLALIAQAPEPAPFADKLTVQPCGHTLEGDDVRRVLTRAGELVAERRRREAEATITGHGDLLGAAETAGHTALVEKYRQAVHARSGDQQGLLVALRSLTGR